MTSDLATQLRIIAYECEEQNGPDRWTSVICKSAAHIEQLEAALREITESARLVGDYHHVKIARSALEGEKQNAPA